MDERLQFVARRRADGGTLQGVRNVAFRGSRTGAAVRTATQTNFLSRWDFHLQAIEHARHTKEKGRLVQPPFADLWQNYQANLTII